MVFIYRKGDIWCAIFLLTGCRIFKVRNLIKLIPAFRTRFRDLIVSPVEVVKRGNSKTKKLKGVTFKIEKILADKKTELVATKETDENGEILFDNLDPGDYVLTETKTLPGYTLMKDPINVTVPMALTTKEAEDMKADTSKGKYDKAKDLYYFYDLTYDVDNEKTPTPPLTGGFENWLSYLPIVLAMALFIGLGIYQMKKRKKPIK